MKEEKILEQAKNGDEAAITKLYEHYKTKVYKFIYSKVKNEAVAEDLLHDTFIKMHKNINFYKKEDGKFYNFILINAKQVIIEYFRAISMYRNKVEDNANIFIKTTNTLDDIVEIKEEEDAVRELIERLPENQAMAIKLVYMKNLSYKQVAKLMGKSELSVKSLLHRAKINLKEKLLEKYPEMRENTVLKVARMFVITLLCISMITGMGYAGYKIYKNVKEKHKFTILELSEEQSEENSSISKEDALEKINYYLSVLGENSISIDQIKLLKNAREDESFYWKVENEECFIKIDSEYGNLQEYKNLSEEDKIKTQDFNSIYGELKFPEEYEYYDVENVLNKKIVRYAKKYNGVFNKYESVNIVYTNDVLMYICVYNYKPESTQVNITKEDAVKILEENNIEYDELVLEFEDDKYRNYNDKIVEEINYNVDTFNGENIILELPKLELKLFWKIIRNGNIICEIDDCNGNLVDADNVLEEIVKE